MPTLGEGDAAPLKTLDRIVCYVGEHYDGDVRVGALAELFGMDGGTFSRFPSGSPSTASRSSSTACASRTPAGF